MTKLIKDLREELEVARTRYYHLLDKTQTRVINKTQTSEESSNLDAAEKTFHDAVNALCDARNNLQKTNKSN